MLDDDAPTTTGLLECLRMLADEASAMQLTRTMAALQQAMETCRDESGDAIPYPLAATLH